MRADTNLPSQSYNPWWRTRLRDSASRPQATPAEEFMPESSDSIPPASPVPDPNEKLVKVFDSEQESEAMVVKGLLDSAGIDSDITSVDAIQDMFPGVGGTVILVRQEDADQSRRLIEEYRQTPDNDETSEIDISEDTPTAG